jgi:hypothetical protein
LYEEIERQRAQCSKITASKDKLIAEIKNELKAKDDEYVKSLKRQGHPLSAKEGVSPLHPGCSQCTALAASFPLAQATREPTVRGRSGTALVRSNPKP